MKITRFVRGFLLSLVFLMIFVYMISGVQPLVQNISENQIREASLGSISGAATNMALQNNFEDQQNLKDVPGLDVEAQAAISVRTNLSDPDKIVFSKNSDRKLPIASISKLMTAMVVLDNEDLSQEVKISDTAVDQNPDLEPLKKGETYYAKDLFYAMLIGSDNTAGIALSEAIGPDKFVELMNQKAQAIGLSDTSFENPTGLGLSNFSTAQDLVKMAKYLIKNYPSVLTITITPEFDIHTADGKIIHKIFNTDELLSGSSDLAGRIIGGKTGNTMEAGECLLLIVKDPASQDYLINIVLNSNDRFGEMKKIIDWADKNEYTNQKI